MVELYRENREVYTTFIEIKPDQLQEFVLRRRPDMVASFLTWEKRPWPPTAWLNIYIVL